MTRQDTAFSSWKLCCVGCMLRIEAMKHNHSPQKKATSGRNSFATRDLFIHSCIACVLSGRLRSLLRRFRTWVAKPGWIGYLPLS